MYGLENSDSKCSPHDFSSSKERKAGFRPLNTTTYLVYYSNSADYCLSDSVVYILNEVTVAYDVLSAKLPILALL